MSMTQNGTADNPLTPAVSPERSAFLRTLFAGIPDELYLELRCIHPVSGEVRTLWGKLGDKRALSTAFKAAEMLNEEGFGVFFAPCPRREKQGKAESAALAPALWVDIDGDEGQRVRGLERLQAFDPPPSAIIDSGGGWHAYWLLEQPFELAEQADREKLAVLLRGVFAALGGDDAYVKSAASVMRLPNTQNTKPERKGALVSIVELHPERRYSLDEFAWLESRPETKGAKVITVNGNGHHPLPERTHAYLVSGAPAGSRNAELFAAACQMRDAGYSQAETERELVARHVADGSSEREALATIASVYNQPARDPIPPSATVVDQLMSRYRRDEATTERPSADEIAGAVRACADLDPVRWAEERGRLRAVCGAGVKVADLDRLYKEARRQHERASRSATASSGDGYADVDGSMVYEKATERGTARQTVTEWIGRVVEAVIQIDDDGQIDHFSRLQVVKGAKTVLLDVPGELFGDPNGLAKFVAGRAGAIFSPRAGMQKHLAPAILALSADAPERRTYRFMGWTLIAGQWTYVSPAMSVCQTGALAAVPEVELESRLRDYRLESASWQDGAAAFEATVAVFPPTLAPVLTAFALLPLVQRFFPAAAPKPALHLVGTTGSGKSEIAALMTSFYGQFTRDAPPAQWGDTVNTVETLGYALADALYWVDDYKMCYADEKTFTRFLQSYSRGMGRGRLTREAKLRQERACRGLLLSTGETTIEGEASILSRMLVLEVPPWEQRDPGRKQLATVELYRQRLPAFTFHFAQWLAAQADAGTLSQDLAARFEQNVAGYRAKVRANLGQQAHSGRMSDNWAVLVTVYQLLREFLTERSADETLLPWQDVIVETIRAVQQERASQVFLDVLGQLIAGGQVVIDVDLSNPRDYPSGVAVVGYREDSFVYLLPEIAHREVCRVHPLRFSVTAIGMQLREEGSLLPGSSNLSVQKRVKGGRARFWQLKCSALGCDS